MVCFDFKMPYSQFHYRDYVHGEREREREREREPAQCVSEKVGVIKEVLLIAGEAPLHWLLTSNKQQVVEITIKYTQQMICESVVYLLQLFHCLQL